MSSAFGFWLKKMALLFRSFWVSVFAVFITLFGYVRRIFFRYHEFEDSTTEKLNPDVILEEDDDTDTTRPKSLQEDEYSDFFETVDSKRDDFDEGKTSEFVFRFQFPTYEEFNKSRKEICDYSVSDLSADYPYPMRNIQNFSPEKSVGLLVEEAENPISDINSLKNVGFLSEKELIEEKEETIVAEDSNSDKGLNNFPADFTGSDSYPDSISSSNDFWGTSELITTSSDGFLSELDFEEDLHLNNMNFEEDDRRKMEEEEEEEEENPDTEKTEKVSSSNHDRIFNGGKTETGDSSAMDSEDPNSLETLWEHQDLLEQLKMELKKVKAIGLPTIFEDSESPKVMEDLKPWKIEEKFEHGDLIDELHKFYKSYREKMRKLDILNYQKMYAIGFLQQKNPQKSFSSISKSTTTPPFSSLLSHHRFKKSEIDPMKKFIRELYSDLETIYVGQMCLSWEFIQWQYDKALDLWESEPHGLHYYNTVAGEFQQFQVLLQRFIENEPFDGPRIESYVKNRCVTRNLLQVPLIREDSKRGRKGGKGKHDYAITSDDLIEILQESIRVVWRFIRADKLRNKTILNREKGSQVELQNPADSQLLSEIQAELQRKKRKVKEMGRSGKCIVKRFQKGEGDGEDGDLYFFSQVDMKVVSRVLKMARLNTEQLLWCQNKLSRISFLSRTKIHLEPSFFLFPC